MLSKFIARQTFKFSKICSSAQEAIKDIKDGSFLLVGGFGLCGTPMNLINAIRDANIKKLTIASNNCGFKDKDGKLEWGLAVLLKNFQVKRMISSYVGQNVQFERQYLSGILQLDICPQGTLAQRIAAGGKGIPAFYTLTGVGTVIQEGGFPIKFKQGTTIPQILSLPKPTLVFNGRKYVMQESLIGDFAIIKAQKADEMGNLQFNKTARNFNADMCTAAKCVIVEVEQIVANGQIDPQNVHIPGIYIDRIYKSDPKNKLSEKKIERLMNLQPSDKKSNNDDDIRYKIMRRAAKQVKNGMNVNLGIGIPTLLPAVLSSDIQINLQSQNGVMGVGPFPQKGKQNADLINAGKQTITVLPGASYFSSSQSFGIIRGGHLDLTMLGSLQVSQKGDIANWIIPGKMVKGMGGAMDLVSCGSKVIVVMEHTALDKKTKNIEKKLLKQCTLPLTAKGVVNMVITELAVFEKQQDGLVLTEIAEGTSFAQVQAMTDFPIKKADNLKTF